MANLAANAVTVISSFYEGGTSGKRTLTRRLLLSLSGQGGSSNLIGKAALGYAKLFDCSNAIAGDDSAIYPAVVNADGSAIYLIAASETASTPGDVSSVDVYITVRGHPL